MKHGKDLRSPFQHPSGCPLWVDAVEKVENRTTSKNSQNSILGRLHDCAASQRRYEAPWSFF
jgi:hypothetical protein